MSTPGSFADFVARIAGPDDHLTLQRAPRAALSGADGRWRLLLTRVDGSILDVRAPTVTDLTRRALSMAREHDLNKEQQA